MHEETLALPGVGAGDIPVSVWMPARPPRGIVLMGHGLASIAITTPFHNEVSRASLENACTFISKHM